MEQYFFTASVPDIFLAFDTKHSPCRRVCSKRHGYTNAFSLSWRSSLLTLTYPRIRRISNFDSTHSIKTEMHAKERKTC